MLDALVLAKQPVSEQALTLIQAMPMDPGSSCSPWRRAGSPHPVIVHALPIQVVWQLVEGCHGALHACEPVVAHVVRAARAAVGRRPARICRCSRGRLHAHGMASATRMPGPRFILPIIMFSSPHTLLSMHPLARPAGGRT